jgi:hypothetical protein
MPLYTFLHSLLLVLVQIANKMGLQKNCCHVVIAFTAVMEQNLALTVQVSRSVAALCTYYRSTDCDVGAASEDSLVNERGAL